MPHPDKEILKVGAKKMGFRLSFALKYPPVDVPDFDRHLMHLKGTPPMLRGLRARPQSDGLVSQHYGRTRSYVLPGDQLPLLRCDRHPEKALILKLDLVRALKVN